MTKDTQQLLSNSLSSNKFNLSDQQQSQFIDFISILLKWNKVINLTGHKELNDIIEKDIIDSLYAYLCIEKNCGGISSIIDMGSGAGFLGITLKIMKSDLKTAFLDSDRKKINFIKQACRELKLKNIFFLNHRAEDMNKTEEGEYDIAISRATWPAELFIRHAHYYVHNNGYILWMSGGDKKTNNYYRPEYIERSDLAGDDKFIYKIQPKNYERKIFFLKKNSLPVSRETD